VICIDSSQSGVGQVQSFGDETAGCLNESGNFSAGNRLQCSKS
jgi:hypothetical protein